MLEGFFARQLAVLLGDYVDGLTEDSLRLDIGLSSGTATLVDLRIKPGALDKLEIPFIVREGSIDNITITTPSYASLIRMTGDPVVIKVTGVYILVDKSVQTPEEILRAAENVKRSQLTMSALWRGRRSAEAATPDAQPGWMGRLAAHVLNTLQVDVEDVHVRYEDVTSCPMRPFTIGATFASFSSRAGFTTTTTTTTATPPATTAPTTTPAPPTLTSRNADLKHFAVYFDALDALSPPGARPPPSTNYIVQPSSPSLLLVTNPSMAPSHPRLKAFMHINMLRFSLNGFQFQCLTYLQQWVDLHQTRPLLGVADDPRGWWHYAVACLVGRRGGAARRGEPRWDWGRLKNCAAHRERYVALHKVRLEAEAAAVGDGGHVALEPRVSAELDVLEVKLLTTEQVLLYRYLAELEVGEEAARRSAAPGGGAGTTAAPSAGYLGGWLGGWGASAPPPPTASDTELTPADKARLRAGQSWDWADLEADLSLPPEFVLVEVELVYRNGTFTLEEGAGVPIAEVQFGGRFRFVQRPTSWDIGVVLGTFRVLDDATPGTAFKFLVDRRRSAPTDAGLDKDTVASVLVEWHPLDSDCDVRVAARAAPLDVVFSPECVRRVLVFFAFPAAGAMKDKLANQLHAIRSRTQADIMATLSTSPVVNLDVFVAAPRLVFPADVCEGGGARLVARLGDVSVCSVSSAKRVPSGKRGGGGDDGGGGSAGDGGEGVDGFDVWSISVADVHVSLLPALSSVPEPPTPSPSSPPSPPSPLSDDLEASVVLGRRHRPSQTLTTAEIPLLDPLTVSFDLSTCVVPSAVEPNRLKLHGRLPRLHVHVLPAGVVFARQLLAAIESIAAAAKAAHAATSETVTTPLPTPTTHAPPTSAAPVSAVSLSFDVEDVQVAVHDVKHPYDTAAVVDVVNPADVVLHLTGLRLATSTSMHSSRGSLSLASVVITDALQTAGAGVPEWCHLLSSVRSPSSTDVVIMTYETSDTAPTSVDVAVNTLHMEWNPDTLAALQRLVYNVVASPPAPTTPAPTTPAAAPTPTAPPTPTATTLTIRHLSISLNKEQQGRKLALLEITDANLAATASTLAGSLSSIRASDRRHLFTTSPPPTHTYIFQPSATATTPPPAAITFESSPESLSVALSPITVVYTQQLWMELADYLLNGMLGALIRSTVKSAGDFMAEAESKRATLRVGVDSPTILVPVSATSPACLTVSAAALGCQSAFVEAAHPAAAGDRVTLDVLTVTLGGLQVTGGGGDAPLFASPLDTKVVVSRSADPSLHLWDPATLVEARLGPVACAVTPAMYGMFVGVLEGNLAAHPTYHASQFDVAADLPPPPYVPDAAQAACLACETAFSLTVRRHRCRACGAQHCWTCSSNIVFHVGEARPVYVCGGCFGRLEGRGSAVEDGHHPPAVSYDYAAVREDGPAGTLRVEASVESLEVDLVGAAALSLTGFRFVSHGVSCGDVETTIGVRTLDVRSVGDLPQLLRLEAGEGGGKERLVYTKWARFNGDEDVSLRVERPNVVLVPSTLLAIQEFLKTPAPSSTPTAAPSSSTPTPSTFTPVPTPATVHYDVTISHPTLLTMEDTAAPSTSRGAVTTCDAVTASLTSSADTQLRRNVTCQGSAASFSLHLSPSATPVISPVDTGFHANVTHQDDGSVHRDVGVEVGAIRVHVGHRTYDVLRGVVGHASVLAQAPTAAAPTTPAPPPTPYVDTLTYTSPAFEVTAWDDTGEEDPTPLMRMRSNAPTVTVSGTAGDGYTASCKFALTAATYDTRLQDWVSMVLEPWEFSFDLVAATTGGTHSLTGTTSNTLNVTLADTHLRRLQAAASKWAAVEAAVHTTAHPTSALVATLGSALPPRFVTSVTLQGMEADLLTDSDLGHFPIASVVLGRTVVRVVDSHAKLTTVVKVGAFTVVDRLRAKQPEMATLLTSGMVGDGSVEGDDNHAAIITLTRVRHPDLLPDGDDDKAFTSTTRLVVGAVDVNWNPETVQALQIFLYQQGATSQPPPADEHRPPTPTEHTRSRTILSSPRLTVNLNKEQLNRKLATLTLTRAGLLFAGGESAASPSEFVGSIGGLTLDDTCTPGTAYTRLIGPHGGDAAPSDAVSWVIHSFPSSSPLDSLVTATVSPLEFTFLNQTVLELADYVLVGFMGPITLDAASVMAGIGQRPAGRNALDITLSSPTIRMPTTPSSPHHINVTLASVALMNEFVERAPHTMDKLTVTLSTIAVTSPDLPTPLLATSTPLTAAFTRCLDPSEPSTTWDVSVPALHVHLTRPAYTLVRHVLDHNIGGAPPAVGDAQAQCAVVVDLLPPPRGALDHSADACGQCGREFGLLYRRHLCHRCGATTCLVCAPNKVFSKASGEGHRCCSACVAAVREGLSQLPVAATPVTPATVTYTYNQENAVAAPLRVTVALPTLTVDCVDGTGETFVQAVTTGFGLTMDRGVDGVMGFEVAAQQAIVRDARPGERPFGVLLGPKPAGGARSPDSRQVSIVYKSLSPNLATCHVTLSDVDMHPEPVVLAAMLGFLDHKPLDVSPTPAAPTPAATMEAPPTITHLKASLLGVRCYAHASFTDATSSAAVVRFVGSLSSECGTSAAATTLPAALLADVKHAPGRASTTVRVASVTLENVDALVVPSMAAASLHHAVLDPVSVNVTIEECVWEAAPHRRTRSRHAVVVQEALVAHLSYSDAVCLREVAAGFSAVAEGAEGEVVEPPPPDATASPDDYQVEVPAMAMAGVDLLPTPSGVYSLSLEGNTSIPAWETTSGAEGLLYDGDVLLAVNGEDAANLDPGALQAALQAPRVLLTMRSMGVGYDVAALPGIHVVLTNDVDGRNAPLLSGRADSWVVRAHRAPHPPSAVRPVLDTVVATAQLRLEVDVFNASNAQWEPVVEPWTVAAALSAVDTNTVVGSAAGAGGADSPSAETGAAPPGLGTLHPIRHVEVSGAHLDVNLSNALYTTLNTAHASIQAAQARQTPDTSPPLPSPPPPPLPAAGAGALAGPPPRSPPPPPPVLTPPHAVAHVATAASPPPAAFQPYLFRNYCGASVTFQPVVTGMPSPALPETTVPPNASRPFAFDGTSYGATGDHTRCLTVVVDGLPSPLHNLIVDQVGAWPITVSTAAARHTLAWEVALVEGSKVVTLRSPLMVVNRTTVPLDVASVSTAGKSHVGVVPPAASLPVPLSHATFVMGVTVRPTTSPHAPSPTIPVKAGVLAASCRPQASSATTTMFEFNASSALTPGCYHRVVVAPPIVIRNRLAVLCRVKVLSRRAEASEVATLEPGGAHPVHTMARDASPLLTFVVEGYHACALVSLPPPSKRRRTNIQVATLSAKAGSSSLFVNVECRLEAETRALLVTLSTSHWMIDRTGLELNFGHRVSRAGVQASAMGSAAVVDEVFENQRWRPIFGWATPFLPTDRAGWTTAAGKTRTKGDAERALPGGWEWVSDWRISVPPGLPPDGWDLDVDFPAFSKRGRIPTGKKSVVHFVRRRRWVRTRRPTSAATTASTSAGGTPSPTPAGNAFAADARVTMFSPSRGVLLVKAGGGPWSKGVSVNESGQAGVLSLEADAGRHELAVSVQQAPAPYHRTKLVTFHQRVVLHNATPHMLSFRQLPPAAFADAVMPFVGVPPGQCHPVSYPFPAQPSKLQLMPEPAEPLGWSNAFPADSVDDFALCVPLPSSLSPASSAPHARGLTTVLRVVVAVHPDVPAGVCITVSPQSLFPTPLVQLPAQTQSEAVAVMARQASAGPGSQPPVVPLHRLVNRSGFAVRYQQVLYDGKPSDVVGHVASGAVAVVGWRHPDVSPRILGLSLSSREDWEAAPRSFGAVRQLDFFQLGTRVRLSDGTRRHFASARVRITGTTLEVVVEDAANTEAGQWEVVDALNPYAGTTIARARTLTGLGDALPPPPLHAQSVWDTVVEVVVDGCGLSVIDGQPREVAYVTLEGVRLKLGRSHWEEYLKAAVGHFQVDDMAPDASFPEVIVPVPPPSKDVKRQVLDVSVVRSLPQAQPHVAHGDNTLLREVIVQAAPMIVNASFEFLMMLARVAKRATRDLSMLDDTLDDDEDDFDARYGVTTTLARPLTEECARVLSSLSPPAEDASAAASSDLSSSVYIGFLRVEAVSLVFNYTSGRQREDDFDAGDNVDLFPPFLQRLLTLGLSIKDARVGMPPLQVRYQLLTPSKLVAVVASHASNNVDLYSLIGSVDALGNPAGLFRGLTGGFKDAASGFVSANPFKVVKGGTSIVAGSVRGVFQSASGLTGWVNRGLAKMSNDDRILSRQTKEARQRPDHVVHGVALGVSQATKGVLKGITGVVTRPIQGAMKEGGKGFFKGLGQGLVGAVVRPLVGVSGGVTKILEGVANTTKLFDKKARRRIRPHPRVFYGPHRILRVYSADDAAMAAFLRSVNSGEYKADVYYGSVECVSGIVAVSNQRFVLVGVSGNLDLMMPWNVVERVVSEPHTLSIKVTSARSRVTHTLEFANEARVLAAVALLQQGRPRLQPHVL